MKPLWPSNDVLATNLRRMKRKRKQEVSGGKKRSEGYCEEAWKRKKASRRVHTVLLDTCLMSNIIKILGTFFNNILIMFAKSDTQSKVNQKSNSGLSAYRCSV